MNIRQSILVIFTLIFFLLSIIFIGFEAREIPKDQNAAIDGILEKITPEIKQGRLRASSVESLPGNCFYSIWVENYDQSWSPLIVANGVNIVVEKGPTWVPEELSWSARTYLKSIDDINYVVWINKYNIEFYIKNIILVALFLLLFYLILVLIISLLFKDNFAKISDDQSDTADDTDEDYDDSDDDTVIEETISETKVPMYKENQSKDNEIKIPMSTQTQSKDSEIKIPMSTQTQPKDSEIGIPMSTQTQPKDSEIEIPMSTQTQPKDSEIEIPMSDSDNAEVKDNAGEGKNENDENEIKIPMYSDKPAGNDNAAASDSGDNEIEIPMSQNADSDSDENKTHISKQDHDVTDETPVGLLTRAEQIIENESAEQMFEHCVAGDENHRVKFTSAEYDALTQPLDFEDLANESDYSEEDETIQNQWKDLDLPAQAEKRNEALLEGYKNLWTKSIKSSSDFRNRFKFKDARSLQRLGQSVRQYLTKALELGQNYFNWEECGFYIKEDDKFEDCKTGMELDTSNIDIPTKGTKKGKIYVPIFPFDNENLFGYLYFTWNNIKDFKLTDVMYFLKFVFSYNAKFIFDKELQSELAKSVGYALSKKGDCCVVSITADNKEKIQLECKDVDIQVLDALIYQRLIKDFKKFDIFQITDLKYVMIGSKVDKLKTTKMFNKWIQNKDKQVYSVKLNQNYALSFSLGAAFRSDNVDNEDTPVNMISRAESLMRISINNGGNKISIQK